MSLTHITKCRLCPPDKPVTIKADQMPQVRPGEVPPEAVGRFVQALSQHLQKRHPEAFEKAVMIGQTLIAYLILLEFETSDPGVITGRNLTRAFVHKLTRSNDLTPADLEVRLERLNAIEESDFEILEQLRDLRDFLLEEGEYAPAQVPEPLVTA